MPLRITSTVTTCGTPTRGARQRSRDADTSIASAATAAVALVCALPCRGGARACRDGVQLGECGRAEMTQETDSETAEGLAGGLRLDSRIRELISRGISDAQIVSKVKHIP